MIPLVISSGPKAIRTAAMASNYYAGDGIASIVVRPQACALFDDHFALGTSFIDDESLAGVQEVKGFFEKNSVILRRFNRSAGWFVQQYIKLAAVAALGNDLVFIADGDTIFSRTLLQSILSSPRILATGEKFENYDRLLIKMGITPPHLSCVANGNIFSQAPQLRELATPSGFCSIIEDYVLSSCGDIDFSEYQIAGGLLEPKLGSRRIRIFRRFDLIVNDIENVREKSVIRALRRYDAIAIEFDHPRTNLKRIAALLFYILGRSW